MTGVLIKKENLDTDKHTGKTPCEDSNYAVTAKDAPEAGRQAWNGSFFHAFRGSMSLLHLDLGCLDSRIARQYLLIV